MALIRVGVLRGGTSNEYEMSLKVGQHILNMLATEPLSKKYKGVDVLVDKKGVWHIEGLPQLPEMALRKVDVVFSALRGEFGEDGKLQQILELFSKPYVGSGAYSSALSQNKAMAKKQFKQQGIKTPYFKELNLEHGQDITPVATDLFRTFPMPVIVKPRGQGSSLGVSFASNVKELIEALDHARGFSNEIVVEEYLTGKEIISGFIDDFRGSDLYHMFPVEVHPHANTATANLSQYAEDFATVNTKVEDLSPEEQQIASLIAEKKAVETAAEMVAEIKEGEETEQTSKSIPSDPFPSMSTVGKHKHNIFDWAAKHSGAYDHKSPANLTQKEKEAISHAIQTIKKAFGLRHFATADFIVHPRRGVYLLEINAHPHLHEHSPIFKSLDAAGIKHHEFLEHLLRLALEDGK